MPILSFKSRFAGKVRVGLKNQTIRAGRKYPIEPGDKLYLYTALRTKYAKKLREVICRDVVPITIHFNTRISKIICSNREITELEDLNAFAKQDGFKDWFDMRSFWIENHPGQSIFNGILITW